MTDSSVVMEGTFDVFSMEEVLEVTGISRQLMEVGLHLGGHSSGTIVVKSGQVLDANAVPDASGRGAFRQLFHQPGDSFRVRRLSSSELTTPLGSLADLIAEARDTGPPDRHVVMEGDFDEFSLSDVLDVLGISRQTLELRLHGGGRRIGVIVVRAGRVLDAIRGDERGVEAFVRLFNAPGEAFTVHRVDARSSTPLGTVPELSERARKAGTPAAIGGPKTIMEGSFSEVAFDEMLSIVGNSRQLLEVVFRSGHHTVGVMLVKSAHLLRVEAIRTQREGLEAFADLRADPGDSFVVYQRASETHSGPPLGHLAAVLESAAANARLPLLAGSFDEFGLSDVVDVVGLSRQLLEIEFLVAGRLRGTLQVKSGQVVDAELDGSSGRGAALRLLSSPGDAFQVYRIPVPETLMTLGSIAALYTEAHTPTVVRTLVMAGDLDTFTVQEVLDVVGLSRQLMEVAFPNGTLRAKAGHLVWASCERNEGIDAFHQLVRFPGTTFTVSHVVGLPHGDSLGTLAELMAELPPEDDDTEEEEELMAGSLSDFSIDQVLDVVALSRQILEVVLDRAGKPVGSFVIKSGHLVSARRGDETGLAAFHALLTSAADGFTVLRQHPDAATLPAQPLGILADLTVRDDPEPMAVIEAIEPEDHAPTVVIDDVADILPPPTALPVEASLPDPGLQAALKTLDALEAELARQGARIDQVAARERMLWAVTGALQLMTLLAIVVLLAVVGLQG